MSIKTLAGISAAAILSILAGKATAADVYAHLPFEGNGNNTVEGSPIGVGGEGSTAANNYITVRGGDEKENKAIVTTASVHPHANSASVFGTGDGTTMTLVASIQTIATQNATMMMIGNSNTPNVLGLFSDGTSGVYVGEITGDSITRLITASLDTATTKLHHYALAYDKGETKSVALYIDGKKVVDAEAVAPTVEPAGSWQLGAPYGGEKKGALVAPGTVVEDFQTFTSILTDEEVAALAAEFPSTTTAPILSQFAPEAGTTTWAAMTGGATLGNTVEITLSGDTTITMGDTVAIANLVIKGTGNLIIPDRENISWGSLTTTGWADRIMTTKVLDGNGVTVPANTTVIINGSEGEAEPIAAGAVTVPAGAGLITHGNIAMTLTNNGTVDIADGVVNVTRGGQQAIKGTVNIANGAVFNNESDDAVAWNGGTTINVRGTLNMGNHRWTVGGSSTLNLFGGCTVTGRTSGDGSIDLYRSNNVITVAKGADDSITDVVLNAKIRVRNDDARISIANGMTLGITGGIGMSAGEGIGLSIVGGGKLAGTIPLMGVSVNLGSTNGQVAKFVASSGTNTLKWTGDGNVSICSTDSKDEPFITVNSGATLKITGKDFSGWNGALTDHGWIANNGTLIFTGDTEGSRFWREHIVFGNNSTMTINNSDRALLMYGGAGTADACQFMLPSGSATIKAGEGDQAGDKAVMFFGNDGQGGWAGVRADEESPNKATGFSVGNGATLTVSCPIQGGQAIAKHGAGTLVFSNAESTYSGTITLNDGSVTVPKEFTGTVTAATGLECRTTEGETTTTYAIIHKVTLKIPTIEHTKIQYQYMTTGAEWVDVTATEGEYTLVVVEEKTGFNFRYISEDETKWTVSGDQGGYKYSSGLSQDTTYNAPKTGITVTPATVTIAIPAAPEHMTVSVTGAELAQNGTITVAPGTMFTVTYTPEEGYCGTPVILTDLTAAADMTIEGAPTTSPDKGVAKIGNTLFASVQAAIAAAQTGDTVALTGAVELSEQLEIASKEITLDLNGQTISYAGAELNSGIILVHNGAGLTITGEGTIDSGIATVAVAVTKKGDDPTSPAKLTVNGGTLIGQNYGISGNGTRANTVITINGGTVKAITEGDGVGIYQPQAGTLTITGGTVQGTTFGVYAKSGTLAISGGTIKSTATSIVDPFVNNNGTNGKGYALVLEKLAPGEGGYADNLTCDITGGTFEGVTAILSWARTSSIRLTKFVADEVVLIETTPSAADIKKSYKDGPTSWDDIKEGDDVMTIITLPEGQTETAITATELKAWAEKTGATFGETIPVNALILNCAPDAAILNDVKTAAAEILEDYLEEATKEVDLATLLTTIPEGGKVIEIEDYPMATIKLVPATLGEEVETSAKLFKLQLELK